MAPHEHTSYTHPGEKRELGGSEMNLDWRAPIWCAAAILYTLLTSYGLYRVATLRYTTAIRLRNLYLIFGSVLALYGYGTLILLAYMINGKFPCGAEFWIMNTLLPFGMALFQLENTRLYHVYVVQQNLLKLTRTKGNSLRLRFRRTSIWRLWSVLRPMERVFVLVVFGTIFEFFATVVLYFGGYQFHPSYGFYGNPNATPLQCRKGWEWVPSVGWQFFWSWIVGPYMLWKVRKIKDTHYWKVQTVAAIIAGMPGTPLWLIFLYVWTPQTQVVQAWLIPAFWFLPCILVMQWTSIVCAVLDAKHTLERAESIAKESTASLAGSTSSQSSMRTLEMIIENDCEAFLNWVAEHDFTAECVLFLMRVRNFRRNWKAKSVNLRRSSSEVSVQSNNDRPRGLDIRDLYYEAAEIFFELVEPRTSEVPVNLSSRLINNLRLWFKDIECRGYPFSRPPSSTSSFSFMKPSNPATPFDDEAVSTQKTRYSDKTSLLIVPKEVNVEEVELANMSTEEICTAFNIPLNFGAEVFDAAYDVVKEDVYRGAWPLYHAKVIGASVGAE